MGFAEDVFDPDMDAEMVKEIEAIDPKSRTAEQQQILEEARANLRRYMSAGGSSNDGGRFRLDEK